MKEFTCSYRSAAGKKSDAQPKVKVKAVNAEEAAKIYAEQYPSDEPVIDLVSFVSGRTKLNNPGAIIRAEKESQTRWTTLANIYSRIESGGDNLDALNYEEFNALVENVREYPLLRTSNKQKHPNENHIRERLYLAVLFNKNLQIGFQTFFLAELSSGIPSSANQGATGPAGSSLAQNAALLSSSAALQKLNQIEENTGDVSEGLGFD